MEFAHKIRREENMQKQSVAIVGLGRVGSVFLEKLLAHTNRQIAIVAVAEKGATTGVALAKSQGIVNLSIDQLVARSNSIDIIFDLTGLTDVRHELREKLLASGNRNTVIATESIASLIWALISDGESLPNVHDKVGY
jgi:glyceraldehyde-3-phosphate dehydrogenase/erythrose-4-phosphate dehydrogenase